MTTNEPRTERTPGYRGALPTRDDTLSRPWILTVVGIFVLILVLSVLGVPSRFIPDPTPIPLPSALPSGSLEPSPSASASPEASESASPEASESARPSPTE